MCGVIMGSRTSTGEAQQRIPLVVWCHLLQFVFTKHKHIYIRDGVGRASYFIRNILVT